jgi:hypothetical protein
MSPHKHDSEILPSHGHAVTAATARHAAAHSMGMMMETSNLPVQDLLRCT